MAENYRSFSDPIHQFITLDKRDPLENLALKLIDTRAFQRLRHIKQLGVISQVYPSADHSRFTHALGTFFVAREMCNLIKDRGFEDKEKRDITLIAALLHDIGHGPLSHIFEDLIKKATGVDKKHEAWSIEIITQHPEIKDLLETYKKGFSQEVAAYISMSKKDRDLYPSIISGTFDADRLDYMLRDRHMCGVSGSAVDKIRIMNSLEVVKSPKNGNLYFGIKINALPAVEEFIVSRVDLYLQIYRHKRESAYTLALNNFFAAAQKKPQYLNDRYSPLEKILKGDISLTTYLETTDADIDRLVSRMAVSKNKELSSAAQKVLDREAYKCIEITTSIISKPEEIADKIEKTKKALKNIKGVHFEDYVIKGYDPKGKEAPIYIYDHRDTKAVSELSKISPTNIANLSKRVFRAYIPKENYPSAQKNLLSFKQKEGR